MFLMDSPRLVALQRKWEAFAPARSCRYPACFSGSEDDIARKAVTAQVQMIINNLQGEEASVGPHSEYGCLVQRKRKGAKGRGHKVRGAGRPRQKCIEYTRLACPADSDGMEVEESSEFGPLLLNSDSDDSVDRDIEEAIQEYLKNKGQSIGRLPSHTQGSGRDSQSEQEHPSDALCHRCPANVNAGAAQYFGEDATGWASSPCSVSSDDAFEQSIKTEIEQFLNEKKQHTEKKNVSARSRQLHPKEGQEKLAARSRKDGTDDRPRRSLKRGGKALFLRRHPEQGGTDTPRGLKSKANEEPPACKMADQPGFRTPLAGYSTALEPGQHLWKAGGEQRHESVDLADSSSDDGIEEAIQLYQLEKIRRAADCKTDCLTFRKEEFRAGGIEHLSSGPAILSVKSALPEIPRQVLSSNRKCVGPKPAELNQIGGIFHNLERSRSYAPPRNSSAKCADVFQASCRADTAAELMCAEAILDISKTILPPPAGSDNRTYVTNPFFCSQDVPPSQYENDGNAVDSDDSIEREIQAFLAVKAQTEHLITNLKEASFSVQFPSSSEQPDEPIRNLKHTFQKPLKMSLAHKRKLKRASKIPTQSQNTPLALPEMCCSCADNICSTASAFLEEGGTNGLRKGDAAALAACQQNTLGTVSSLPPECFCSRNQPQNTTHTEQKYGAGDQSSSLDSDEDLDMAIRDLLRSKRKLKKKSRDQRIPYKKKVRFGKTEMHIFEDEREYESKTSASLKSCLMRSRRTTLEEDARKASPRVVRRKPKRATTVQFTVESKEESRTKPSPGPEIQGTEHGHPCRWTPASLTNDSSSIDSDDSIEQEIRRFLAEKAKDSGAPMEPPAAVDVPTTSKPQASPGQAKRALGRGDVLLEPNRTGKAAAPPAVKLSSSLGAGETAGTASLLHAEGMSAQAMRRPPANRGLVQTKGPGFSARRTVLKKKVICDQRSLPSEKEEAGSHNLQSYLKSVSPFKRRSPYGLKIPSKLIAGVKSAPTKKKSVILGKRQSTELSLFRKQGAVPVAETLGEGCANSVQKASLSSKTGAREAEGRQPRMPERKESVASAPSHSEAANLAQVTPLGDHEPCNPAGSSSGPSLQEHKADDARGIRTSPGPSRAQVPVRGGGGMLPECGGGSTVPGSTGHLPLGEKPSPGRTAKERPAKGAGAGAAACTDSAGAERLHCLARGTSSSL